MTTLQDSFSCNFNILIDGNPKVMGIKAILNQWLKFRMNCLERQIKFDILKKSEKVHLLEGLSKILNNINKAVQTICDTQKDNKVISNLIETFNIDNVQAEFISEIKLKNLNKEYISNRVAELEQLKKELEQLNILLQDDKKIKTLISKELKEISKKYGKPRVTEIVFEDEIKEISTENLIEDYAVKLFLTQHNYFKKISIISLRMASDQKLKPEDTMLQQLEATNKSDILLFSNKSNVYKLKAYELNDSKASNLGDYLPNILDLEDEEKIIYVLSTLDYSGYMLFGFSNGKVAKIPLNSYLTKVNRKKLINAYSNKSNLIFIKYISEDEDLILIRDKDKAVLFNTSLLEEKSVRNSVGTQIITLKKNSKVSSIKKIETNDMEYYRVNTIPSSGHFIKEKDKTTINLYV